MMKLPSPYDLAGMREFIQRPDLSLIALQIKIGRKAKRPSRRKTGKGNK